MEKTNSGQQTVLNSLRSATLDGNRARVVDVEASFTKGLPSFTIVGLASESIKESKERVKSALLCNGFKFPPLRITINLSPSDLRKEGSHFDLSIALLIALQQENLSLEDNQPPLFILGELGLDGAVKETQSTFPIVLSLVQEFGSVRILASKEGAGRLAKIPGAVIYGVGTLSEAQAFFRAPEVIAPEQPSDFDAHQPEPGYYVQRQYGKDFREVVGQERAKRAALIAAAGMHNLLLNGSPGCGKSMIVQRLREIMPPLSVKEILSVALLENEEGGVPRFDAVRPFRQPHHSATKASIFGGGSRQAKMGEIALANAGVLFFDELPHFPKTILEALREPLEDHRLLISRVNTKIAYDAKFLFAAAMNPCPCGNLLSRSKNCRCTELEVQRYRNRLSEPFLDRIDLYVEMEEYDPKATHRVDSTSLHEQVLTAFRQRHSRGQVELNGKLDDRQIGTFCQLDRATEETLTQGVQRFNLSMRSRNKVIRIARTIADLAGREKIISADIMEALSYRYRS